VKPLHQQLFSWELFRTYKALSRRCNDLFTLKH
jgi:hypothetical protein